MAAVNNAEGEGTTYGTATPDNIDVNANKFSATVFRVQAIAPGTIGNAIASTEVSANLAWDAATLTGGASEALVGIPTPDDVAIVSIGVIGGFVLLVTALTDRVYFIRPPINENVVPSIDPLDFFEAEQLPDQIHSVRIVGDEIWFFGEDSTEVWYLSGVGTIPFDRIKGRAFSRGIIPGTDVEVDNSLYVVGKDFVVYEAAGGLNRVSTHGIEEQIRLTIEAGRAAP